MPRRSKRVRIDRGIFKDATGYEVVAHANGHRRSKRFPIDTSLNGLRAWRDGTASELHEEAQPTADASTLAGAIQVYLDRVKPKGDVSQLRAWSAVLGTRSRRSITAAHAQQCFDAWQAHGYSRQTLRIRRFALQKLWRHFDGPTVKTPVDKIRLRKASLRRPIWVHDDTILDVLMEIRRHEMAGWIRSPKTRARFLVLVTTGQRPTQLRKTTRRDVDLERRIWWVPPAKDGERVPLYLNAEQYAALTAFVQANAWGHYDARSFARTLRSCGWPPGIAPYNVRHAVGMTLSARGRDLGDIQQHLGHTTMATTRAFYVPGLDERFKAVSASLDGRFADQARPGRAGVAHGADAAPRRGTREPSS